MKHKGGHLSQHSFMVALPAGIAGYRFGASMLGMNETNRPINLRLEGRALAELC